MKYDKNDKYDIIINKRIREQMEQLKRDIEESNRNWEEFQRSVKISDYYTYFIIGFCVVLFIGTIIICGVF